jgi:hypothetical protein
MVPLLLKLSDQSSQIQRKLHDTWDMGHSARTLDNLSRLLLPFLLLPPHQASNGIDTATLRAFAHLSPWLVMPSSPPGSRRALYSVGAPLCHQNALPLPAECELGWLLCVVPTALHSFSFAVGSVPKD